MSTSSRRCLVGGRLLVVGVAALVGCVAQPDAVGELSAAESTLCSFTQAGGINNSVTATSSQTGLFGNNLVERAARSCSDTLWVSYLDDTNSLNAEGAQNLVCTYSSLYQTAEWAAWLAYSNGTAGIYSFPNAVVQAATIGCALSKDLLGAQSVTCTCKASYSCTFAKACVVQNTTTTGQ